MTRGSEKILAAWRTRLDDEDVSQIASYFDASSGSVDAVRVHGGAQPAGLSLSVSYSGDDGPQCGNDLGFWLAWLRKHGVGGVVEHPRIILKGTPWPEFIQVDYAFGATGPEVVDVADLGSLAGTLGAVGGVR